MEHLINHRDLGSEVASEVRDLNSEYSLRLNEYVDRLLWWNKKINLVSRDVSRETLFSHIEHSLIISKASLFKKSQFFVDAGTGGGLPGIPLAIVSPSKQIVLNDIVAKKIMACKHIVSGLGLSNVDSEAISIEKMNMKIESVIISKHAFKLNDLIKYLGEKPWKGIIMMKGRDEVKSELAGITEKLDIEIINLESAFKNAFYEGKAMVIIKR